MASKKAARVGASGSRTRSSSTCTGRGASSASRTSERDRRTWSANAIRVSRFFGCLISVGAGQKRVEIAELGQKLHRRFDADAGGARHIVHAVTGEGLDFHHALGAHAELFHHLGGADLQLFHRVEHRHLLGNELHQVLVGGDDDHLAARVSHHLGVGGDQVVRLIAVELHHRHAEGPRGFAHQREIAERGLRAGAGGAPCTGRRACFGRCIRRCRTPPPSGSVFPASSRTGTSTAYCRTPPRRRRGGRRFLRVRGGRAWKARKI